MNKKKFCLLLVLVIVMTSLFGVFLLARSAAHIHTGAVKMQIKITSYDSQRHYFFARTYTYCATCGEPISYSPWEPAGSEPHSLYIWGKCSKCDYQR